jgi:hypothetical protein
MTTKAPYCGDIGTIVTFFGSLTATAANLNTLSAGTASSAESLHKHTTLDGKAIGTSGNVIPLLDGTNTWSGTQTVNADLKLGTAGNGLYIKTGTNATAGTVTGTGGYEEFTVYTNKVTANSMIFVSVQNFYDPSASVVRRTPGTSFVIEFAGGPPGIVIAWLIVEPA